MTDHPDIEASARTLREAAERVDATKAAWRRFREGGDRPWDKEHAAGEARCADAVAEARRAYEALATDTAPQLAEWVLKALKVIEAARANVESWDDAAEHFESLAIPAPVTAVETQLREALAALSSPAQPREEG